MKILFEEYRYKPEELPSLEGIDPIELKDGGVKLPYVGYYYDVASAETIFILPKVFIIDKDVDSPAFKRYKPETLCKSQSEQGSLSADDQAFLFSLSAWLYQAIALFNERHPSNEITSPRSLAGVVGHKGKDDVTLLDHVLSLLRFNREHQSLFTYIATIKHTGQHRIHWTKTIRTTTPLVKGKTPYYLECRTKDKTIDYDEELICFFYSTLDYLRQNYHFVVQRHLNYKTEKPHRIANMIECGKGTRYLRKIRGKYFKDELVQLWNLLYAFYERAEEVAQKRVPNERLLVRNFNIVFEDMIDCLIGESELPKGLKEQKDGKIIDHIYRDKSLVDDDDIYFIGDSKYYKEGSSFDENSRYKQITYAKNVIQYNIDLFNRGAKSEYLRYRDELTEGYNPTPNFFIRGFIDPRDLSYADSKLKMEGKGHYSYHFENRLFDRDTLLVLTYNINFLYVLSAYVQSRGYSTSVDRFLRDQFRQDIIVAYQKKYDFYQIELEGISREEFVASNFKLLIGKMFQTKEGKLILALEKNNEESKLIERLFLLEKTISRQKDRPEETWNALILHRSRASCHRASNQPIAPLDE